MSNAAGQVVAQATVDGGTQDPLGDAGRVATSHPPAHGQPSRRRSAREGVRAGLGAAFAATWPPMVALAALVGLWYVVIALFELDAIILPPPHDVLEAFFAEWGTILDNSIVTLIESAAGLGLAVVIGSILAMLIAEIRFFSRAMMPLLIVSQAVPKVAVAPLFVIWFGFGLFPKVVVAFFIAFFPVVVSGASGLRSISREELDLFRTMTSKRLAIYRHLKIPRALPQFFDGVKVGAALALVGAVVGEFVSSEDGLGNQVLITNRDLATPEMFAVFIALSIVGMILFYGIVLVERLLLPWYAALHREASVERA